MPRVVTAGVPTRMPLVTNGLWVVERHHVLVERDVRAAEGLFRHLPGDPFVAEVDEHEVVVGAAADQIVATLHKRRRHGLGVLDDLLHVSFVAGLECFTKRHCFSPR